MLHVSLFDRQKDLPLKSQKKKIDALTKYVVESENRMCDEVSVFLISDKAMRRMHKEYFNDPTPTDCISFPLELDGYLGDIFVCPATAISYASDHKSCPYRETTLYIIHGLLHLLGYDDIDPKERRLMRKREKKYLQLLEKEELLLEQI